VDLEKVKDPVARQVLQGLLKGEPGVRVREEVYVPKKNMDRLPPEDLQLLDLLQEIDKRAAERSRLAKRRQGDLAP
jgi:hypothetical protein